MVRHLIFKSNHLALKEAEARALVEFQTSLHVEAAQPRPGRSLMVGLVALCLRTYIYRIVAATLRRERTQSLRCEKLTRADVNDRLLLLFVER